MTGNHTDTILQAQTALISGRLAIEGELLCSQPMYNHAMAFRHSIDKGQRVLQNLVDEDILLPRWGSHSLTPPPVFKDLQFFPLTNMDDWRNFCGAGEIGPDGMEWWIHIEPIALHQYASVKAADAARVWFRLMVGLCFDLLSVIPRLMLFHRLLRAMIAVTFLSLS